LVSLYSIIQNIISTNTNYNFFLRVFVSYTWFRFSSLGSKWGLSSQILRTCVFRSKNFHAIKKKGHNYHLTLNVERNVMVTKRSHSHTEFTFRHFNFEHQNMKICMWSYNNTHTHTHTFLCINKCIYFKTEQTDSQRRLIRIRTSSVSYFMS
jgi:hypothetical protein